MEVGDFGFIRDLAARQANFTVPPPYVLWLLLRIKDTVCLVAEHNNDGPVAYVLAVPIEAPSKALYVWQLATSEAGQRRRATLNLLTHFIKIAKGMRIRKIAFSAIPGSPAFRMIRRYAVNVFSTTPEAISTIPSLISLNEREYHCELT